MTGSFRLMTYNVRSDDGRRAAPLIRACAPDVVCVQEAPRFLRWRTRQARLARESALFAVTGGYASGVMILGSLRTQVVHEASVPLSRHRGLHHRALALAVLDLAGGPRVTAASVHLDLEAAARRAHAAEVLQHLDRVRETYTAPVVLAGDMNEEPGGPAWSLFSERLGDAYAMSPRGDGLTFPARSPRRRIDAVFVDPQLTVACCGVPELDGLSWRDASDHRAVVAELT